MLHQPSILPRPSEKIPNKLHTPTKDPLRCKINRLKNYEIAKCGCIMEMANENNSLCSLFCIYGFAQKMITVAKEQKLM
jgi:hypothetical protein